MLRLYITQPNYYIVKSLEEFESCLDVPISINDIINTIKTNPEARQCDGEAKNALNSEKTMTAEIIQYLDHTIIPLIRSHYSEIINKQVKTIQSLLCVKPGAQSAKSDAEVYLCVHQFNE